MPRLYCIFSSLLFTISAYSQTGTIQGSVHEDNGFTSVPGTAIYLENTIFGSQSNGQGNFIIKGIVPGDYVLVASNLGYQTLKKSVQVKAGENLHIEINLPESVVDLPVVNVEGSTMTGGSGGVREITGSAAYISPKQMQMFSYSDANRTLRTIPGVNLQEEDGFGLRPNIGLRGSGVERTSKITIMEDGVLSAPAPYASPAAYYFPTIGRMRATEVLKGSSQIKYGPFTTGGAINFVSTQIPSDFSGRVHFTAGSYGSRNIHANTGNSHKNFGYMVETYQYSSDGFKHLDNGGNTGFDKKDYLAKFRVNTDASRKVYQSLTFKIGQAREISNETYLGLTEEDYNETPFRRYAASQMDVMTTKHEQYSLTHVLKPSKFFDITTTVYHNDFHRNWYKLDAVKDSTGIKTSISNLLDDPGNYNDAFAVLTGSTSTRNDALYVKANDRTYFSQGLQSVLGFDFISGKLFHNLNLGVRVHEDEMDRFQSEDQFTMKDGVMYLTKAGTPGTESNQIASASASAAFIQYTLKYGNLTFVPGLRYENVKMSQLDYGKTDPERTGTNLKYTRNEVEAFIPGAGIDYKFTTQLSVFAGVHKGFAPPGVKPETKPEESVNSELGLRYLSSGFSANITAFHNDYRNLLGSDLAANGGNGTGDLFNGGKAITQGLEMQLSYDVLYKQNKSYHLPVSLVYTYTDAIFKSSFISTYEDWGEVGEGDELPYMARHQFSFLISLEHQRFSLNLSAKYMDAMRTVPGKGDIPPDEGTDASLIFDASASVNLNKNVKFFGSAVNLTDQTYIVARRPAGVRPGMPLAFQAGIKADF